MNKIRIGKLLPGARTFSDSNINSTYLGHLTLQDGSRVQAFVKIVELRELFIECCCAIIGRELKINIPEPFIVILEHDCGLLNPGSSPVVGFGTENATFPSLRRTVDWSWAVDKLIKSQIGSEISIFDEWINNPDRHLGNILFDGTDKFVFIDHGLARIAKNNPDEPSTRNIILDAIAQTFNDIAKYRITSSLPNTLSAYTSIGIQDLPVATHGGNFIAPDEIEEVVTYLSGRVSHLQEIVKEKLKFSQTGLTI